MSDFVWESLWKHPKLGTINGTERLYDYLKKNPHTNLNEYDTMGHTALASAIVGVNHAVARLLVSDGFDLNTIVSTPVDVNAPNESHETPLIVAIHYNAYYFADLLIKSGADVLKRIPETDATAVHEAWGRVYATGGSLFSLDLLELTLAHCPDYHAPIGSLSDGELSVFGWALKIKNETDFFKHYQEESKKFINKLCQQYQAEMDQQEIRKSTVSLVSPHKGLRF